jgi:hypothetical protein
MHVISPSERILVYVLTSTLKCPSPTISFNSMDRRRGLAYLVCSSISTVMSFVGIDMKAFKFRYVRTVRLMLWPVLQEE